MRPSPQPMSSTAAPRSRRRSPYAASSTEAGGRRMALPNSMKRPTLIAGKDSGPRVMSYRRRVRVLVLGGTGFIGPDVARELVQRGHDVTIFHRGTSEPELPELRHLHGDRERMDDSRDAFLALRPDVALDMRPLVEKDAETVM